MQRCFCCKDVSSFCNAKGTHIFQLKKSHFKTEMLKAPYSSNIDIFLIQEKFNKSVYGINKIIK